MRSSGAIMSSPTSIPLCGPQVRVRYEKNLQSGMSLNLQPRQRRLRRSPSLSPSPDRKSSDHPVREDANRVLALWHLLSLDAPTVAALWTWFIARSCRIHLPGVATLAMAVAVWTLYVADRLLDAQLAGREELEARHYFHSHHRFAFLAGIAAASVLLATLLPQLPPEAIRLYLILGGFVFGYFVIIHATESARRLPKE